MQRTLYAYKLGIQAVSDKHPLNLKSLEDDFMTVIVEICLKDKNERKERFSQEHKVLYLDAYEYSDELRIVNLKFISAKYDSRRRVVNTETLEEKGILKSYPDGDEEKNHICIKFLDNNEAVCLSEYNYYGIGFGKIVYYLQKNIKSYHRKLKDGCYYNLTFANLVSKDFLESLSKVKRVKAVTLTVDQDDVKVSDFKALSGRNDVSKSVDILLKPASSDVGIWKNTVTDFFNIYKKMNIKRVTVSGDGQFNEKLSFNTEEMKQKIVVGVDETGDTGEVNTRDIFDQLFVEIVDL